jgi:hypothetical protein
VYGRGALYRGVDRQIADIVVVEPERELFSRGKAWNRRDAARARSIVSSETPWFNA